ncbi:MAG TPA: DUF1801 domain-containing protein [Phycisphaerales bacterium]|nr:DUF1801 domain-containing protein [Phycisphaerales bacterium]
MQSQAASVKEYLASLPDDRKSAISTIRNTILKNLNKGFEEGMQYGMIGYYVPHSIFPAGYHCDPSKPLCFASLASQKNHMALYLMCAYGDTDYAQWFTKAWKDAGKKLDMGKSCMRFKRLDDVPLGVVAEAFKRVTVQKYLDFYTTALAQNAARPTKGKPGAKKAAKPAAKKSASKSIKAKAKK